MAADRSDPVVLPADEAAVPPGGGCDAPLPLQITREGLRDGSLLVALRASAPPGYKARSEAELRASLDRSLATHPKGEDLYVFGYGSLMWNPAFHHIGAAFAHVHGWSRRFCLWLYMGRGCPAAPGLMLALDRGGACRGTAYRVPAESIDDELMLLWRREMSSGAYEARWVSAVIDGRRQQALTFVANRSHERYVKDLSPEQAAHYISTGEGRLGSCLSYFESTVQALRELGVRDLAIERLRRALQARATAA